MPTEVEWLELIDNCSSNWTNINGISGRLFTSKKTGYTDKSIFLPAGGGRKDSTFYYVSVVGYYWSSQLNSMEGNGSSAYGLGFGSGYVYADYYGRCYGLSVRPVSE